MASRECLGTRYVRGPRRGGAVLVWATMTMGLLIMLLGLVLDTAYVYLVAHQLQNASDAAALAGARHVLDDQNNARSAAYDLAYANKAASAAVQLGLNTGNDPAGDIVIGRFDRDTQLFEPDVESPNAIKVVARRTTGSLGGPLPLLFAPVYGFTSSEILRDAIAIVEGGAEGPGIILLKPSGDNAFEHSGDGTIHIEGTLYVNSTSPKALVQSGNGTLEAESFQVVGEVYQSGNGEVIGTVEEGVDPETDPFAALPVPVLSEYPVIKTSKYSPSSSVTLLPGRYQGGLEFSSSGVTYTLGPGIYIVEGGGFKITGNCIFNANEVMVYNCGTNGGTSNADQVLISSDAQVNWTPITSGTYAGFGIFQHRSIADKKVQLSGNGEMNMTGIVYARSAQVQLSGNGTTDVIGGGFVADSLQVSGNGTFSVGVGGTGASLGGTVYLVE